MKKLKIIVMVIIICFLLFGGVPMPDDSKNAGKNIIKISNVQKGLK